MDQQPQTINPEPSLWRLVKNQVVRDEIGLRASALSYATLASLVPLLAIMLTIFSGPAFQKEREKIVDNLLERIFPAEEEGWVLGLDAADDSPDPRAQAAVEQQARFRQIFRDTIVPLAQRAGAVSLFGFLVLLVTVGLVFRNVEMAFNAIWKTGSSRSFFMRVAIATSLFVWVPVVFAISVALSEVLKVLPFLGTYLIPGLFTAALFTALFAILPHAKVRVRAALVAGVAAALTWELLKLLFLIYVTRVVNYSKVYGSLGLIPILFLWVYLNWLVILSGAVLGHCLQERMKAEG